ISKENVVIEKSLPFREYINWIQKQDATQDKQMTEYWKTTFEGTKEGSQLSSVFLQRNDISKAKKSGFECDEYQIEIESEMYEKIRNLSSSYDLTTGSIFQALWGILLRFYLQKDDVIFGCTFSGRSAE